MEPSWIDPKENDDETNGVLRFGAFDIDIRLRYLFATYHSSIYW